VPFCLSAVSEVVADRMSAGDRIIEEGEAIIVVPASAPQPCVLEAFGKEQTGIGPWGYPLNTEAQGKEKDWYREHGQRTPVIGSIDSRSSIDDRTSEAGEDRLLRNENGVALSCAE
jgi:hypothetical protein